MKSSVSPIPNFLLDLLQTVLRMLPWPTATGVRPIGHPGPESPVLVTCNYDLTVRRVMKAIRGEDAWLLVAPSSGINVWCAAAGGHFSTHQIVMALKSSGIENRVTHRNAILPQLAATGVITKEVRERAGWRVQFGPASARDIPEFLRNGHKLTPALRTVRFSPRERFEMAVAWAAPASLILGPLISIYRLSWGLLAAGLVWVFGLFAFFFYEKFGHFRRPGLTALSAVVGAGAALVLFHTANSALAFAVIGPALAWIVTADYSGSTPIEGVTHFDESTFTIALDADRCRGAFTCEAVCPENVFERSTAARKIILARPDRCIRCAACIVQCPFDALYLQNAAGERVEPSTIRQYKLNLLGKRKALAAEPLPSRSENPSGG